jgi:hypothetical protein
VLAAFAVLSGGEGKRCHEEGSGHNEEHAHWQPSQHGRTGC